MSTPESTPTVDVDGEERPVDELIFVSLVGSGLVVQHQGWAEEELQGPGQVPPDPMDFGDEEAYEPQGEVEAKELLNHPHRQGNRGAENWFALYDADEAEDVEPTEDVVDQIPEGYAKVDGELVPVEDLVGDEQTNGTAEEGVAGPGGPDLDPLTAPEGEAITTKQEAYEALAAAGVDLSADGAPNMSDSKTAILEYAHDQGFYFPNYE